MKKLSRRILLLATALLFSMTSVQPALGYDGFYMDNDIFSYDANAGEFCFEAGVVGDGNVEKMWNYLTEKGLTPEQAAGVLGNIKEEGGFSATRQEDSQTFPNGGWGIVQWTGSRRTQVLQAIADVAPDLIQYHDAKYGGPTSKENGYVAEGIPEDDAARLLSIELEFLYQEATTRQLRDLDHFSDFLTDRNVTEWEALTKAKTIRQASDVWLLSFERPLDQSERQQTTRANHGQEIFDELNGTASSGNSCAPVSSSGIAEATLLYAHPRWMDSYSTPKPEYAELMKRYQDQGLYTAGTPVGSECGTWVTALIRESGHDRGYNYNGKGYPDIGASPSGLINQENWAKANWSFLGGSDIDVAELRPGDVAFWGAGGAAVGGGGHTFAFVGDIEGFESNIASASLAGAGFGARAPMAGTESLTHPGIRWYGKR